MSVVDENGKPVPPGPSVFDVPDPEPPAWQPPTDAEHAAMQKRIGDAYAAWDAKRSEDPPPPRNAMRYGDAGEYPAFSHLLDADGQHQDELRDEVLRVAQPDTAGA